MPLVPGGELNYEHYLSCNFVSGYGPEKWPQSFFLSSLLWALQTLLSSSLWSQSVDTKLDSVLPLKGIQRGFQFGDLCFVLISHVPFISQLEYPEIVCK